MSFNDTAGARDYAQPVPLTTVSHKLKRLLASLETSLRTLGAHCKQLQLKCRDECTLQTIQEDESLILQEERGVRALIVQLRQLKRQVVERDHYELDRLITPLFKEYQAVVQTFQKARSAVAARLERLKHDTEPLGDFEVIDAPTQITLDNGQRLILLDDATEHTEAEQELQQLADSVGELNELFTDLLRTIEDQREDLDDIRTHMDEAAVNTHRGAEQLIKANRYKAASYPMAGALVGAAILGPVGLAAGLKIGAAFSALVGVGLGSLTGKAIGSRLDKRIDKDEALHRDNADQALLPESQQGGNGLTENMRHRHT